MSITYTCFICVTLYYICHIFEYKEDLSIIFAVPYYFNYACTLIGIYSHKFVLYSFTSYQVEMFIELEQHSEGRQYQTLPEARFEPQPQHQKMT